MKSVVYIARQPRLTPEERKALLHAGAVTMVGESTPLHRATRAIAGADIILLSPSAPKALWGALSETKAAHTVLIASSPHGLPIEPHLPRAGSLAWLPGINAPAVSEHTWALILALARPIGNPSGRRVGLSGKTLGIIGTGHIGRAVAAIGGAFGMRVIGHNRSGAAPSPFERVVAKDELFAESDIISIHLPLTAETNGFIGKHAFARMRPGTILVNTARAPIVHFAPLVAALTSGRLGGYGLDADISDNDRGILDAYPNVIVTPHVGYDTPETKRVMLAAAIDAVLAVITPGVCP